MTKSVKIICVILAFLITILTVVGMLFYVFNYSGKNNFSLINLPSNADNYVKFNKNVYIASDSTEIQKNFKTINLSGNEYTLLYKEDIPNFFKNMKVGEIFCVYPDSKAKESFFALGFCGQLSKVNYKNKNGYISFTIPELTKVFSDIYINSAATNNETAISTAFYPSNNITGVRKTNIQKKKKKSSF